MADISIKNRLIDGFIDDVDFDNGFVYYNQITFEGAKQLMEKLQNQSSPEYHCFVNAVNSASEEARDTLLQKLVSSVKIKHTLFKVCCQWKERISANTASTFGEGHNPIRQLQSLIIH